MPRSATLSAVAELWARLRQVAWALPPGWAIQCSLLERIAERGAVGSDDRYLQARVPVVPLPLAWQRAWPQDSACSVWKYQRSAGAVWAGHPMEKVWGSRRAWRTYSMPSRSDGAWDGRPASRRHQPQAKPLPELWVGRSRAATVPGLPSYRSCPWTRSSPSHSPPVGRSSGLRRLRRCRAPWAPEPPCRFRHHENCPHRE